MPLQLLLLLLFYTLRTSAQCQIRLPVASQSALPSNSPAAIIPSSRILSGIRARNSDFENIVTISFMDGPRRQYRCVGTIIAPEWILTSAQCRVRPSEDQVLYGSRGSLLGFAYDIANFFTPPGFGAPSNVIRDDIQLIRLTTPIFEADIPPDPTLSPTPTAPPTQIPAEIPVLPNPSFNFMKVNSNENFAIQGTAPRYLRVKGYGLTVRPEDSENAITGVSRPLTFADLRTAKCEDGFGNDGGRRICTKPDKNCGPCFGDTGSPLYDVDASGRGSVQVGIVTFGVTGISPSDPICTDGKSPIVYTAVAPYVQWIENVTMQNSSTFFIPGTGITNTTILPEESNLSKFARMSVIVISSLALIGLISALVVTCTLRTLRRRRRRWVEGLHAEESFVKGGVHQDSVIIDPFEGMVEDRKSMRGSIAGISRAAIKGAGEFSSRSIGAVRAFLKQVEEEENAAYEEREPIDDAPQWLPDAWDRLFKPPSRKDQLKQIHTVPTQRVVDDVLEGGDRTVEPTLQSVAYKNARDEANIEAAWKKLEMQTSLRNISEASGSVEGVKSPASPSSFSSSKSTPRHMSRQGSRKVSQQNSLQSSLVMRSLSPPMDRDQLPENSKADTLLAAFASIDAESEQVAEETVIDSSALRTLAMGKRSNVLSALRKKFSSGSSHENLNRSNSDRNMEADTAHSTSASTQTNNSSRSAAAPARNSSNPGVMLGNSIINQMAGSRNVFGPGQASHFSANSSGGLESALSRNSALVDYFSEEYDMSDSSSDGDEVHFEDYARIRRFTDDRLGDGRSSQDSMLHSNSGKMSRMRKSPVRSFESLTKLERNSSSSDGDFEREDSSSDGESEKEDDNDEDEYADAIADPEDDLLLNATFGNRLENAGVVKMVSSPPSAPKEGKRKERIIAPKGDNSGESSLQSSMWSHRAFNTPALQDVSLSDWTTTRTGDRYTAGESKASDILGANLGSFSPQTVESTDTAGLPLAQMDFGLEEGVFGEGLEGGVVAEGLGAGDVAGRLETNVVAEGLHRSVVTGKRKDSGAAVSVKLLKDMWNEKISRGGSK